MRPFFRNKRWGIFLGLFFFISVLTGADVFGVSKEEQSELESLLPEVSPWKISETPQRYLPETLFEYINGAAEIYLSYDFKELVVAQYKMGGSEASLTLEIYDMGSDVNSFGIYSAERYPDSRFLPVGNQGYLEEGTLNFISGRFYTKLLCFECGDESEGILQQFSKKVVDKVENKGSLPPALKLFPSEGLVKNSEKFVLRNFLGHGFLRNGYVASYKVNGKDFECFSIEGKTEDDAESMLKQLNVSFARNNQLVQEISLGYHVNDRYLKHVYLARVGKYICGVSRITDGFEEVGEQYLEMMVKKLGR